ncbi:MAG: nucleotidyltransferase family protein [Clostridia bacterium]|nr:nucleotidyltransferase family protein [Clostridia bacterium]
MTATEKQFVQLLRAVISGEEPPAEADWAGVWDLAGRHHLENMIWKTAKNDPSVPDDIRTELCNTYYAMIARDMRQQECFRQIKAALEDAGIRFAPLKGLVLCGDYPETDFRFMSDLDVYIRPEDRRAIRKAVEGMGGRYRGTESGDEQFVVWDTVGVEFHGRLLYRKTKSGIENYPDWRYVDGDSDRLTEEGYALNLIGHAVHDLAGAGPGIRYILDLWIYRNRHLPQPDWEAVEQRLRADNIYEAAKNLLDLSEYLFGDGEETPLMTEMADYVLKGGLHGDYKRGLASQAAGGKAVRKQLFRDRTEFENRYPWLKKYPFLLPVAWVMRIFQSFKKHRKVIKDWRKGMSNVSADEAEEQRMTLMRFGL